MGTGDTAGGPVGPAVVRMVLGARMRSLREASGITCANAGYVIRGSHSKISRLERGQTAFKRRDVADLLTLYGVSDEIERNDVFALVDRANRHGWLHEYGNILSSLDETRLELEQCASVIRCYENQFVPALLQTPDYARALIRSLYPDAARDEIRRRTELLAKRQEILSGPEPCRLWAIIDEAALRRRPGSAATMRRQLKQLIQLSELAHITIQVMPFSTGTSVGGAVTLLRFAEPEVADVAYLDQFSGSLYLAKPADVQHYAQVVDRLCTKAEQPAETPAFLRRLSNER